MEVSKTRTSFYRRLYVAWLIDSGTATSVPALMAATGMPRRTAQHTLAALAELDIECRCQQDEAARNNAGQYAIHDCGPLDKQWIAAHLQQIKTTLGYP